MTLTSKDKIDYEAAELVAPDTAPESQPMVRMVWGVLRLMMGFTFLWAFLDKLLAWVSRLDATPRPEPSTSSGTRPGSVVRRRLKVS